jgi:translocation and assembly module TamB
VERNVERLLNRPLQLGEVESLTFNGLNFGAASIPATATDPDRATAKAVEIAFNPVQFLLTRTLELEITLVEPDVYLEQNKERQWVSTKLQPQEKGAIDVKLQALRFRDADVVLVPRSQAGKLQAPVTVVVPSGETRFLEENQLIKFELAGQLVRGGNFTIEGQSRPSVQQTNLVLAGQNLVATEISRLLQLPLVLQAGNLDGNLEVRIEKEQPLKFFGTANLENVTARIPQLPKPFANTNGRLRFRETQVRLENVKTLFGQVPAEANGVVDTQSNYNLTARTQPVAVKQVLQTFNFKELPVTVSGQVQTALRVTGPLAKPVVSGEVVTTKPALVDRVNFRAISAKFGFVDSRLTISNLRAIPTVGGVITGNGRVQLGEKGGVVFDVQAANVPGDAIAKNYNVNLPVPIGAVSARTQIFGSLDNLQNLRATGSANLNVAGGSVIANNVQVIGKRFSTQVRASGVQLDRLAQVPPSLRGPVSGNFNLFGSLDSFSPSTLRGNGSASLNIAGGNVTANNIQLANGRFSTQVRASGVQLDRLAQVPPALRGPISGNFNLSGSLASFSPSTIQGSGSGRLNIAGGTVTASNVELRNGNFTAQVQAAGVQLGRLAQVPPALQTPVSGNFNLSGSLTSFSPSTIRGSGSGRLNIAGGTVTASNVQLRNGRFTAQVQASSVQLGRLASVPPSLQGGVSGNFNLSGSLTSFSPSTIQGSGSGRLNIGGGTLTARNVQLGNGNFTAQVQASGVQLGRLASVPPSLQGGVSGNFNLSGSLTSFSPSTIQGSGSGRLQVDGGTITANNVQLRNGNFEVAVETSDVPLERFTQVPPSLRGGLASGRFNLSGSLASFSPSTIQGSGSGRLQLGEGTLTASNVQLRNGRFEAVVESSDVQLSRFSQDLRGNLDGRLNVSGSLAALSPSGIRANGQLSFSEGVAFIDKPLTTSLSWNGQQLAIQQANAEGFDASGVVSLNPANPGVQAIQAFNLNVRATDLNLQQLGEILPNTVDVAGRADFDGSIAGTVSAPNVNGTLALRDFVVAGLRFESPLEGNVNTVPGQSLNLNLEGETDQIRVALAPNNQPISFFIQRGDAIASGERQGEVLRVSTQDFPIAIIKELAPVPAAIATQPFSGTVSGNLDVNLNTFAVSFNDLALTGPIFDPRTGDDSLAVNSRYLLSGTIARTATSPVFQNLQLRVEQGELETLLAALEVFNLTNLSPNSDGTIEAPVAVNLENESLQTQLRRLSEIEALAQQREAQAATSPLPDINLVDGRFSGTVQVDGSLASGITAQVNIQGENWEWDTYNVDQVSIVGEGSFQNGVITLLPLRIQSGDSLISYAGTIGGEAQSGQLQLRNIPIDELQTVLQRTQNVPPALSGFTGLLNATATLSGSINNPQARGELSITDATINRTPVQSAQGGFSYANARLNFGSTVLVSGTDPLNINGSIPYKLPFASVKPADNQIALNIDVQNEGLAFLNLLSGGQVTWVDGLGDVQLAISGTLDQDASRPLNLVAQGSATVEAATIAARALPEPLTNVNGTVLFNFDRIQVDNVQGQFSGGTVAAAGTIPISQPVPQENPLTVNIGELAINLKGLYNGRVQGDVIVTGTALAPQIGGEVNLFDGQVQIGQRGAGAGGTGAGGATTAGAAGGGQVASNLTEFNNLTLNLGEGVQIRQDPILNFLADGTLTLNGPLDGIRPEGIIRLERGQVNLFTTQFRLARSYENTAEFLPNRGLDPVLDVRLQASVAETTQRRLPTDPLSAEISDAPTFGYGSAQTVRVEARVEGPASQLADNIELTSSPSRSEVEIVALLGGGFVDTLGRGDTTLGLANLAGSALLSNVQNIIGDALGLSEFRLFPTINTDEDDRSSSLGLTAEASLDISRSFSISVLKELTTEQPFEYNLRYRLNDELLLRGGTNFSGDSRALIEYERRF